MIRKMTIEDYDQVYNLWMSVSGIGIYDIDDSKEAINRFIERNPDSCFVAEIDKKIVGAILVGNDGRRAAIYHTAVNPEYAGQGIGKALVNKAIECIKEMKISKVHVVVYKDNEEGNAFWEKMGFNIREDINYRNKELIKLTKLNH